MNPDPVREQVNAAVQSGVAPGAQLVYGDGDRRVDSIAAGLTRVQPTPGQPVTPETRFDVASVTKPAGTTAVLMRLIAEGAIDLNDSLRRWIPEATVAGAERVEIRHLVGHGSGFPAHIEFFRRLVAGERAGASSRREALLRMAATTELAYQTGTQTTYSDLGFIMLGFCLERAGGDRLDALARRLVFEPLAMTRTGFVDLCATPPASRPNPVAATEICPYRGLVEGEVHDDNCHAGGGIHGHAGLFSTAEDLERFAVAMLAAARGETGLFDPAVVGEMLASSAAPDTTWRLGFDTPSPLPSVSHAGDLWPRDGVGHLGFTGCSLWLDPPRGRYAILLTNRVHPSRDKLGILEVRRSVMDAIVRDLNAR